MEALEKLRKEAPIDITPQVDRQLTPDERQAVNKVNETLRFNGERYEVAVLWKQTGRWLKGAFGQLKRNWRGTKALHRHTSQWSMTTKVKDTSEKFLKRSLNLHKNGFFHTSRWLALRTLRPKFGSYLMARLSERKELGQWIATRS